MNSLTPFLFLKRVFIPFYVIVCFAIFSTTVYAQEKPPKPITVTVNTVQHLSFGTFIQAGDYGTVTVSHDGARTASGSIILPNMSSIVTPALFEVNAIPGTLVTIVNGPDTSLSGSHGGTVTLKIGDASTGTPFLTTGDRTDVFIGGTLIVNSLSANPAGDYSGIFQVTFIQQ